MGPARQWRLLWSTCGAVLAAAAAAAAAEGPEDSAPSGSWPLNLLEDVLDVSHEAPAFEPGDACSVALTDNPDVELECKCDVAGAPCASQTVSGQLHCGGIAMKKGGCLVPTSGVFKNVNAAEVSEALKLRHGAAEPLDPGQPWCRNATEMEDSEFVGPSALGDDGRYAADDGEWVTKSCRSLPLSKEAVLRAFPGKRLLFLGDNQIRYIFTALEVFAEAHGLRAMVHYSVGTDKDYWRMVNPADLPGVEGFHTSMSGPWDGGPPFVPCEDRELGAKCVDFIFVWGQEFADQKKSIKGLMSAIEPHAVLTSVNGYDRVHPLDHSWSHLWDEVLEQSPQVEAFTFMMWPYNNPVTEERMKLVREWLASKDRPYRASAIEMGLVHSKIHTTHTQITWSDICQVHDVYPKDQYSVQAFGRCTAPASRALARVALTLFRPLAPDEPTIGQAALADTLTHADGGGESGKLEVVPVNENIPAAEQELVAAGGAEGGGAAGQVARDADDWNTDWPETADGKPTPILEDRAEPQDVTDQAGSGAEDWPENPPEAVDAVGSKVEAQPAEDTMRATGEQEGNDEALVSALVAALPDGEDAAPSAPAEASEADLPADVEAKPATEAESSNQQGEDEAAVSETEVVSALAEALPDGEEAAPAEARTDPPEEVDALVSPLGEPFDEQQQANTAPSEAQEEPPTLVRKLLASRAR